MDDKQEEVWKTLPKEFERPKDKSFLQSTKIENQSVGIRKNQKYKNDHGPTLAFSTNKSTVNDQEVYIYHGVDLRLVFSRCFGLSVTERARVELAYIKYTVLVFLNLYSSEEVYHVTVARFHFQAYRIQLELALFL